MIEMTLEGGKELEAKLTALERKVGVKIARESVREAIKMILMPAKANALSMVGGKMGAIIARALQIRVGTYHGKRRRGQYYMKIQHNPKYNDVFVHESEGSLTRPQGKRGYQLSRRTYIPAAIEYGHVTANGGFVQAIP